MALKNFTKIKLEKNNQSYWKLFKINGDEVVPFTEWSLNIQNKFAFQTRDKYTQVVSKFLDYLIEVNIFEEVTTKLEFKNAIENYKLLLSYGKSITDKELNDIAYSLDFNKISNASWSNNIAAINSFLRFVFEKEEDEREYLLVKQNIDLPAEYRNFLPELNRIVTLNHYQKEALKQKSYLANLYRKTGDLTISGGIKSKVTKKTNQDLKRLDFPAIEIPKLLNNTSCFRNRAIYALLAGTGIRSSEALSLTWDMIDIDNQKVLIQDLRENNNEKIRFKGRDTAETFFIPELRHIFFQALYEYQLNEANNNVNHNYVFQFLNGKQYGEAYYTISRQNFIKEFKRTVKRANIKPPVFNEEFNWTPHSLRHFYGVYMLNYIPLNNGYGFSLEEVQKMMGHKSIEVTRQYARTASEYIQTQLEYAELKINGEELSLNDFNKILLENLSKEVKND